MEQVLLVEDEIFVAEVIKDALEDRGLQVKSAHDDRRAYDLLEGEGRSFSVLIADINLGPGADGFDVARPARELHPGLKVVYITGHAGHLQANGVEGSLMVPKPFYPDELAARVMELLRH
jgi:DNA-binding response OmpR family regulator